ALVLNGPLGSGSAAAVRQALEAAPEIRLLHLNSQGGRLFEGQAIAREVRARGLDTFVEGLCASACTLIFVAGADRGATVDARLGFHSASLGLGAMEDADPSGTEFMLEAYRAAGLSPEFLAHVKATPHSGIWYPTHEELLADHVVTRFSQGG